MSSVYFRLLVCRAGWLALSVVAVAVVVAICPYSCLWVMLAFVVVSVVVVALVQRPTTCQILAANMDAIFVHHDLKPAHFLMELIIDRSHWILAQQFRWSICKWFLAINRGRVRFRRAFHHMREQVRWPRVVPS